MWRRHEPRSSWSQWRSEINVQKLQRNWFGTNVSSKLPKDRIDSFKSRDLKATERLQIHVGFVRDVVQGIQRSDVWFHSNFLEVLLNSALLWCQG